MCCVIEGLWQGAECILLETVTWVSGGVWRAGERSTSVRVFMGVRVLVGNPV